MASYLTMPIFMMDSDENLVYYNGAGEVLLGRAFVEAEEMNLDDLPDMFQLHAEDGSPLPLDAFPLSIALRQRRPAYLLVKYQALDEVWRSAKVTAVPLESQARRHVGAMCFWWEDREVGGQPT